MNNQEYKLYLKNKNYEVLLLESTLLTIDEFTTNFKNRDELISEVFSGLDFDYSTYDISIESKRKRAVPIKFLGSDFNNVSKIFADDEKHLEYTTIFSLIDPDVLINYFNEKIEERVENITNLKEKEEKREAYLNNKKIPVVKLINLLIEMKKVDDKTENNPVFESLFLDVSYHIREYCSKYIDFRDIYSHLKALGLLPSEENLKNYFNDSDYEYQYILLNSQDIVEKFVLGYETKEKIRNEARIEGKKIYQKDEIIGEAKELGTNAYKLKTKKELTNEAKSIGEKIFQKEKIIDEGIKLGRQIHKESQDNFTLEYNKTNETDDNFNNYLKMHYENKIKNASTEEERIELIDQYNDEVITTYDEFPKVGL